LPIVGKSEPLVTDADLQIAKSTAILMDGENVVNHPNGHYAGI
jgi:hypothetical protein